MRQGAVVQLKAAVDYLEMVEMSVGEPEENLPALTRALSTFYGWEDPQEVPEKMHRFLRKLCVARLGKDHAGCQSVRRAAWACRRALYEDLLWVCKQMKTRRIEWQGNHSLETFIKAFELRLERLQERRQAAFTRWPQKKVPKVKHCEVFRTKSTLLEVQRKGIWVNGVAVTNLEKGRFPQKGRAQEALQGLLVAGVNSAKKTAPTFKTPEEKKGELKDSRQTPEVMMRASRDLPISTLRRLFVLLAEVNLRRVGLRVYKKDGYGYPCALDLQLHGTLIPPPHTVLRLEKEGLKRTKGGEVKPVRACGRGVGKGALKKILEGSSGLSLGKTSFGCFLSVVTRAARQKKGKPVHVWLGGAGGRQTPAVIRSKTGAASLGPSSGIGILGRRRFGEVSAHHRP